MQQRDLGALLLVFSLLRTTRASMGAKCSEAALAKLLPAQIYVQRWKWPTEFAGPFSCGRFDSYDLPSHAARAWLSIRVRYAFCMRICLHP